MKSTAKRESDRASGARTAARIGPLGLLCTGVFACASMVERAANLPLPDAAPPGPPEMSVLRSSVPLMPRAVTSFGAAVLGRSVYAFGGYSGVPHAYSREGQSGELSRLDLDSGEGARFVPIAHSEPSQGTLLASLGDALFRVGGMRALNARGEPEQLVSLSEVWSFDPRTSRFSPRAALPEARSSHALAVVRGKLYVVGGWTLTGARKDGQFAKTGFAYDPAHERWTAFDQPFALRALAAAALDGKLVVLGGMRPDASISKEVHVYDPDRNAWTRGPDFPGDGFGIAAASDGDTLYASARDGVLYALDGVEAHAQDVAAGAQSADAGGSAGEHGAGGSWRPVKRLALPRFFHQLVIPDAAHVLAIGGISGMHFGARIRAVEVLDVTQPGPQLIQFTLPNPWHGRNRQGVFAEGDSLYVFGGNRSLNQHDFAPDDFVADAGRLDLAGLFWQRLPDFPRPRQSMQTLVIEAPAPGGKGQPNELGLALGGFGYDVARIRRGKIEARGSARERDDVDEERGARAQADGFAFDFAHDRWDPSPYRLDQPRTQFGLTEHGGALWIFGGLDFDPARVAGSAPGQGGADQFQHPRSVLRAQPGKPFAPSGVELPHPRRAFGGAQLDGRYYLVGGMAEGFAPVTSCDVFTFETRAFTEIPCPTPRISPQLVALGGKLYLAGGSTPGEHGLVDNPALEVFDPQTQTWTTLIETLPIPPRNLSMLVLDGRLALYSAHNPEGVVRVALIAP
jgi:hypothetical protein